MNWTVDLADTARKGTWPVVGGVLDQADVFHAAARLVWAEESYWRAKLNLPSHG